MSSGEFKICPFCNELIEASLEKCPHCLGSFEGQQVAVITRDEVTAQTKVKARIGLARFNGILLLLFGYGSGSLIVKGNFSHGVSAIMLSVIIVGVVLVSGSLFGFLAAFNPASEMMRKLAKGANLTVVGMCIFAALRSMIPAGAGHAQSGFTASAIVYGFILNAIVALPAVLNLRAFWKPVAKKEGVPLAQTQISSDAAAAENVPPVIAVRQRNYFLRHWRGELPLAVSYWVNGLLGTFAVFLAGSVLAAWRGQGGLRILAVFALLLYATGIVVSVWQCVGVWRSASNHVSRGGKAVWAVLAKVIVVVAALNGALLLWNNYIPQSMEMVSILAGDKGIPAYQITVLPGGSEMEFRGGLRAGSANALEHALSLNPQVKVLHIESAGGRIDEAEKMIELVRARGLTTYTAERCDSAATLVLLAGRERVVAAGAEVGFHQATLPGVTDEQQREVDDLVRSTMQTAGVSEEFINKVLATPHDKAWYPTMDEMMKAGVVTSQTYGERFANSWGGADTNVLAGLQKLDSYPCFGAIREVEPETYRKMTNDFVAAVRAGKSEGEALAVISQVSNGLMGKYLLSASDEALLALRDQWIGMLTKYKDKDSRACIAAFKGEPINFSRAFPDWDLTNSLRIVEKVIRSGASGKKVRVNKKTALEDYSAVFAVLEKNYGNDTLLLVDEEHWTDHSQKVCDLLLAMYQQIAALPEKRSANLVRSIVTGKTKQDTGKRVEKGQMD